ncbi:MAG: EcsC family protein [Thermosynechococcus sp.]|uniref:EcsC family protein n=1 Tax=Thermosynechococcus sp. TaxID=2814275 RepID=UPI0039192649
MLEEQYDVLAELPELPFGLAKVIAEALSDGEEWGKTFLQDPNWGDDRDRMANHAIYEATLWSVGSGVATGVMGWAGLPLDFAHFHHAQIKLAAALFTIHGFDLRDRDMRMAAVAAAVGVGAAELATYLGRRLTSYAVQNFVQKPAQHGLKNLLAQIFSKSSSKTLLLPAKAVPLLGGVIGGSVNAFMMNACGHSVCQVIKALRSATVS